MQAKITNDGDCVIVYLMGRLDVETAGPFRSACLGQLTNRKVVFSFRDLSFVGSSGILPFLETMQDFAKINRNGFKFCHVGSEFKKLLAATTLSVIEVHENERTAVASFVATANVSVQAGMAGAIAVPINEKAEMPPMKVRAITEGVNPIFTPDTVEAAEEGLDEGEASENMIDASTNPLAAAIESGDEGSSAGQ